MSNTRKNRKAAGLCPDCGGQPVPGKSFCVDCRERDNKGRNALYAARRDKGLCAICGGPRGEFTKCDDCRTNVNTPGRVARQRVYRSELRAEVHAAYGGKCACCRETEPLFLEVDHVNNNGHEHRRAKKMHGGPTFYHELKRLGFPKADYQLLCANCNRGKHLNGGVCPHKARTHFLIAA